MAVFERRFAYFSPYFSEIPNVQSPDSTASHSPNETSGSGGSGGNISYDDIDEIDTENMAIYNDEDEDDELNRELAPLIKQEIIKQENNSRRTRHSQPPIVIQPQKNNQKIGFINATKLKREPTDDAGSVQVSNKRMRQEIPQVANNNSNNGNVQSLLINSNSNHKGDKKLPEIVAPNNSNIDNNKKSNNLLSDFLITDVTSQPNLNVDLPQPSSSRSNGKSMMYGKDYLVPDEMPKAIFDENSQVWNLI